jgi:hypothetical protein
MMHVFYCIKCKRYRFTNNQSNALCCEQPMYYVDVKFTDFVKMNQEDRKQFLQLYALAD